MPFAREQRKGIPTSIGNITISFMDVDGTQANFVAVATATVLDEDGRPLRTVGPHSILTEMTAAQRTAAWNFMQAVRSKATNEVLPPPA